MTGGTHGDAYAGFVRFWFSRSSAQLLLFEDVAYKKWVH